MKIWILILVKRGFIEEPEIFCDASEAKKREKKLLRDFNPDYDEIAIFEKRIKTLSQTHPLNRAFRFNQSQ
jgi:hypothetical protein